jgi:hypothetical protein
MVRFECRPTAGPHPAPFGTLLAWLLALGFGRDAVGAQSDGSPGDHP